MLGLFNQFITHFLGEIRKELRVKSKSLCNCIVLRLLLSSRLSLYGLLLGSIWVMHFSGSLTDFLLLSSSIGFFRLEVRRNINR